MFELIFWFSIFFFFSRISLIDVIGFGVSCIVGPIICFHESSVEDGALSREALFVSIEFVI